jgi:hypothetical protein
VLAESCIMYHVLMKASPEVEWLVG